MARTFVVADLHGRRDLLAAAVQLVVSSGGDQPTTLVTLGDYVDKGPESRQVVEMLMELSRQPPPGWRVVCLKGNHEAMMEEALLDPERVPNWTGKGGDAALKSYGAANDRDIAVVPDDHRAWIAQLDVIHIDRHRVYVHAGVDVERPLDQQLVQTLLCKRYPSASQEGYGDRHVVHGHDRARNGPLLFPGRTNLDTMAWSTGRLVVGLFDDDIAGGPIDLIEVRGAPYAALPLTAGPG